MLFYNVTCCLNISVTLIPHFSRIFDNFWHILAQLYILADVIATVMVDVVTICLIVMADGNTMVDTLVAILVL